MLPIQSCSIIILNEENHRHRIMKYIENYSNDPRYNLAFEEYCFKYLPGMKTTYLPG